MVARMRWIQPPSMLAREVELRSEGMQSEMLSGMQELAGEAESWMKSNRPWSDRTNQARENLKGTYKGGGDTHGIEFSHNVRYGLFLEKGTIHMKRYPIILPAIQTFAPKARAVMNRAVKRVVG